MQQLDHPPAGLARENPHFRVGSRKPGPGRYTPQTFLAPGPSRPTVDTIEFLGLLLLAGAALHWANRQGQRERTARLAGQLQPFHIERLMQRLTQAYLQALAEPDPQRQAEFWQAQAATEQQLAQQFQDFARAFAQLPPPQTRTLRVPLPGVERWWPQSTFDTRRVMQVHADGITRAVLNPSGASARDRAYTLLAEMLLMQHSCHWYCRNRAIASARLLAQHQTRYEQALQSVSPETRQAYLAVVRGPALGGGGAA